MPGKISHFKPLIIGALEAALNRYLTLDEQIDLLLTPIAGKVIYAYKKSLAAVFRPDGDPMFWRFTGA